MTRLLSRLSAAFLLLGMAFGQAYLSPPPKFRAFDSNGAPLVGGKLYSYLAGTTTAQATYSDSTAVTANSNPVVLDGNGEANVWLKSSVNYKLVLKDSAGVQQWSVDNVNTNSNFCILTGCTISGLLSVKNVEGIRFADRYANIQAAITDAGTTGSVIIPPSYTGTDTFTNSSNIMIWDLRKSSYANLLKFSTYGLALNSGATLNLFGDSITVGSGAAAPSTGGYAALLASSLGFVVNNQAVTGSQAQDAGQIDKIYATAISQTSSSVWLPGFNDMRLNGTGATPITTAKNAIFAGALHAAIPDAYRVAGSAAGCTKTGSWSTNAAYSSLPVYSTTNANTVSCANIRGSTVYLVTIVGSTGGGQLTVSVDGTQYGGTYNLYTYAASNAGRTYSPFVIRIPNLTSGPHTVLVTVASATDAANSVNVVEVAGNGGRDYAGPSVYLGQVLHMTTAGYALSAPFNNGSDSAVDAYNAAILDVCRQLSEDGLAVVCVDTARYNPTNDVSSDSIHPSDTGHQHIADAFLTAVNGASEAINKAGTIASLGRRSVLPLYSPLPNNFGLILACVDATNCQLGVNRDPVSGNNLNPADSGAAINFGSDGVTKFYTTSSGGTGTATEAFRITAAAKISTPTQFVSTLATGTAPLSITSTTPVANLTTVPATYIAAGTQQTATHLVIGRCTLGTDCAVTLVGSAVFTSSSSYQCGATDTTAIAAIRFNPSSGSAFALTGTGTDVLSYVCAGN